MRTTSPILNSPFSSWAWYFFERRTVLPITGWMKRRSTFTTTVLAFLSLTTVPCKIRFGMLLTLRLGSAALLGQNCLDARDVAAQVADTASVLDLAVGALEAQVELLFLQARQL